MYRLVNRARKNDSGFSLVELIVVILIIAIIAIALAPQVMKYVGQSRTSVDDGNAATIKSAVQSSYAEFISNGGTKITDKISVHVDVSDAKNAKCEGFDTLDSDGNDLDSYINETIGEGEWPEIKSIDSHTWTITIEDEVVAVAYASSSSSGNVTTTPNQNTDNSPTVTPSDPSQENNDSDDDDDDSDDDDDNNNNNNNNNNNQNHRPGIWPPSNWRPW